MAKLYYFVQKEIRYVSIKGSLGTGLSGHPASETFEKRYGDCVDKAVLLSTMLKVIGVEAYPVSVNTNDSDRAPVEIPSIYSNHAITEVHLNGEVFYLDSTSTYYRYPYFRADDQGIPVINEIKGTINEIPVMPPEHNWNMYSLTMELNENGDAVITEKNNYHGEYEAGLKDYYSYYSSDEMRRQIFRNMANDFAPGAEFEYYKMSPIDYETPFSMEYKFKVNGYPFIADDLFILNPRPKKFEFPEIAGSTRRYPIEYNTSQRTDNKVELIIPENFSVRYLPPKFSYKDDYVEYNAEFKVEGKKILYSDTFKRFKRIIPAKDYKKYREVLLRIQEYSADTIILQKTGGEER
ncbi:MAG TPA: transglutaminase domain-containing protein [Firmicutes bacterium]|nr:transglutaminase domain-containing protein [Bacillota bacterium]